MTLYPLIALMALAVTLVMVAAICQHATLPTSRKIGMCTAIAAFMLIGSAGLYLTLGQGPILPLIESEQASQSGIRQQVAELEKKLQDNPKDLPAWLSLGTLWMNAGQFQPASQAYKQAVLLSGGNAAIIMQYAIALIMANDGTVSDEATESLKMVLTLAPKHPEARYYMAIRHEQQGEKEQAIQLFDGLLDDLPEAIPLSSVIARKLVRLKDTPDLSN